ncbi:MAG TPA: VWA domain-containing protein [Candidatus Paceibacterota bacterium]|nr:VWA domain-containing protein [Candidatus Paceibacterota bacterium]
MLIPILFAATVAAQVPTFSATVDMVGVTVTAVDSVTGIPVPDLTINDLAVFEDGVYQQMAHFGREDVPASILVLVDASGSVKSLTQLIQDAATRLILSLREYDEVQVAQFGTRYQELTDFTTDHEIAAAALSRGFVKDDSTSLTRALLVAIRSLEMRHPGDAERRRIIVLLSDGENTMGSFSEQSILDQLRRSGVLCYVVHIARIRFSDEDRIAQARQFMERVAHESGGRLVTVPYDHPLLLATAYTDIANELGTQYHIAYLSSATKPGWHEIAVVLRSRVGITLRFRRGYYVPLSR